MPALNALAQHAALPVLAFRDDKYIVCSPEQVAPLCGALSDALWARASVQLNQGKTRPEGCRGAKPQPQTRNGNKTATTQRGEGPAQTMPKPTKTWARWRCLGIGGWSSPPEREGLWSFLAAPFGSAAFARQHLQEKRLHPACCSRSARRLFGLLEGLPPRTVCAPSDRKPSSSSPASIHRRPACPLPSLRHAKLQPRSDRQASHAALGGMATRRTAASACDERAFAIGAPPALLARCLDQLGDHCSACATSGFAVAALRAYAASLLELPPADGCGTARNPCGCVGQPPPDAQPLAGANLTRCLKLAVNPQIR